MTSATRTRATTAGARTAAKAAARTGAVSRGKSAAAKAPSRGAKAAAPAPFAARATKATAAKAPPRRAKAVSATPTRATKAAPAAATAEHPTLSFADATAWAIWLAANHGAARGVWIRMAKKASGIASVTYAEALDEALAWGWIDGQRAGDGDRWFRQKFTPRGKRSIWSKINRDKIAALTAAGRMQAPGLAEVERARADGRWAAAYDSPSKATVPPDLAAALAAEPAAAALFAILDATNRYAILFRLHGAKKEETRARRLAGFVAMLARGETIYPMSAAKRAALRAAAPARGGREP